MKSIINPSCTVLLPVSVQALVFRKSLSMSNFLIYIILMKALDPLRVRFFLVDDNQSPEQEFDH